MYYKKLICFSLVLLIAISGMSEPGGDEKKLVRGKEKEDPTELIDKKISQAEEVLKENPEKAIDLIEEALLLSLKGNYRTGEANCYLLLGDIHNSLGQFSLAYKNFMKAYPILSDEGSFEKLKPLNLKLGSVCENLAKYEESLLYYEKYLKDETIKKENSSIKLFKLSENQTITHVKGSIADVYMQLGNLDQAKKMYDEIINESDNENSLALAEAFIGKGKIAEAQAQNDQAIEQYELAQNTAVAMDDPSLVNKSFDIISELNKQNQDLTKALETWKNKLEYNIKKEDLSNQVNSLVAIAQIYLDLDQAERSLENIKRGMQIAERSGDLEQISKVKEVLSIYHSKTGNSELALQNYKDYLALEDSINKLTTVSFDGNESSNINSIKNRILLLEKDRELSEKTIQVLKQEQTLRDENEKKKNIIIYSLVAGLIIVLIASVITYRNSKAKKVANQLLALRSLRNQMNPHFIYNALNSVNNFISKSDERSANQYLTDFSNLMRNVMQNSQHDFVSLGEEIDILKLYLKLEHSRFSDKFDYTFSMDENINLETVKIPPMLIQPYVENAVWHGLRYKEGKGKLEVVFTREGEGIKVVVRDNGIGRKRSQELKTKNQKAGISTALKNIQSRISILNELKLAELDVRITDLSEEQGSGTVVEVLIPKIKQKYPHDPKSNYSRR